MSAGYVYVLANSSLPGLIKVGKTSRSPAERALELSGPTGVATPFLVVYEQFFKDCDAAEAFVHTALAAKNLRVSENREFFRAQPSDVIEIITQAPGAMEQSSTGAPDRDSLLTADDGEFASFRLDGPESEPWDGLMDEADAHYLGFGDHLQDNADAMRFYRQAAAMGSPRAYEMLGRMHQFGEGVVASPMRALEFYKEGAKRGNYYCYAEMAILFFAEKHSENGRKSFLKYVEGGELDEWSSRYNPGKRDRPERRYTEMARLLLFAFSFSPDCFPEIASKCRVYAPGLQKAIAKEIERANASTSRRKALRAVSEYFNVVCEN